jgi:hypothetical protein
MMISYLVLAVPVPHSSGKAISPLNDVEEGRHDKKVIER